MRRWNVFGGSRILNHDSLYIAVEWTCFSRPSGKWFINTWRIYFFLVSLFKYLKSIVQNLNKPNLGDLIAAISLVNSLQINSRSWFFGPYDLEIRWMNLKTIKHLCWAASSFVHHFTAISELKSCCSPETSKSAPTRRLLVPCDIEN